MHVSTSGACIRSMLSGPALWTTHSERIWNSAKDPGHVEANYQAASLLTRRGSYSAALQHLSRLPAESQQHAATRALRCASMAGLGRKAQTETSASELLSAPGLTETDVVSIVPVLLANHEEDVAVRLLIGLQTRSLASAATFRHLAAIHEKQGRIHEARAALESSPEMLNPSAGFLSRVAQLAYEAKDLEGALGYLARGMHAGAGELLDTLLFRHNLHRSEAPARSQGISSGGGAPAAGKSFLQ